jgi:hypothetical protein
MGVYNKLDVAFQEAMETAIYSADEELADTVAWYRAHYQQLPPELMRAILTDEDFFQKALTVWDNRRFSPKPASEHVALQPSTVSRRDLRPMKSYQCVAGWTLIGVAFLAGVVITVVALW